MADIDGARNALIGMLVDICRYSDKRETEMTNFIEMLRDTHADAVQALAGANLISAKLAKKNGQNITKYMDIVRELVASNDAAFSYALRAKVFEFIDANDTPNPWDGITSDTTLH